MGKVKYRKLSNEEIRQLIIQGCYCANWQHIEVIENFVPDRLRNVNFSGFNRIGRFDKEITLFDDVHIKTGIYNACIHNCIIENNVLINNVKGYITNYHIGDHVVIQNISNSAMGKEFPFEKGPGIWVISAQAQIISYVAR